MNIILEDFGHDYYIAEVEGIVDPEDLWFRSSFLDIDAWCTRTFGNQDMWGEEPESGWKRMMNKYYFVKDSQRAFFILRWAGE